jgi:glutathionyl-hydroquinone reductase
VDLYLLNPSMGENGWFFDGAHNTAEKEPLYGFTQLRQLYHKADPDYQGRFTVPVLWDKETETLISNESADIIRMLFSEFDEFVPERYREVNKPNGGFYPAHLRKDIDEMNEWVYDTVNNGVYKTGFATTQEAYEASLYPLFESLDRLEQVLGHGKPFLFGDHLTEADIRLYTSLARFDVAYYPVFQCNLKLIRHDYPRLHLWLRRLYWDEGETTEGAFHHTTAPWIRFYGSGYMDAQRKVSPGRGSTIQPRGPAVLMEPLKDGENL